VEPSPAFRLPAGLVLTVGGSAARSQRRAYPYEGYLTMRLPHPHSRPIRSTKTALFRLMAAAIALVACYFVVIAITDAHAGTHARRGPVQPPVRSASTGSALTLCPSNDGVEYFTSSSVKAATNVARHFGDTTRAADLASSDRAWWPDVRHNWADATGSPISHLSSTGVRRLVDSPDLGGFHLSSVRQASRVAHRGRLRTIDDDKRAL
jgi:hypothetical protein